LTLNKDIDIADYEKKCRAILEDEELRFAGLVGPSGELLAGGYKEGVDPHITPEQHTIIRKDLAQRVQKRSKFDAELGHVKYTASRRENVVTMSLPINKNVMMIMAEPHINIDRFAFKIITKLGRQWGDYST